MMDKLLAVLVVLYVSIFIISTVNWVLQEKIRPEIKFSDGEIVQIIDTGEIVQIIGKPIWKISWEDKEKYWCYHCRIIEKKTNREDSEEQDISRYIYLEQYELRKLE